MTALLLSAAFWIALHLGLAGTRLRDRVVAWLGENGFRAGFSLLSVVSISLLVRCFNVSATAQLWVAPGWLRWLLLVLMLPAFLLFFGAVLVRSPTAVGGRLDATATGILRVTRHPMLWSFALWALLHMAGNGNSAALLFFGAFAITALAGMPSIDAKLVRRDPVHWRAFAATTSILPFGAILAGRNRLSWREIGWLAPLLAVLAWAVLLFLHPRLFGVYAVPPV